MNINIKHCKVLEVRGWYVAIMSKEQAWFNYCWNFIHPDILCVAKSRSDSGHYADATEASFKEINGCVKTIVKAHTSVELDGGDLMEKAFSTRNPVIKSDDLSTESGYNTQLGYLKIFSGSISAIRNPNAHMNSEIKPERAMNFILLASLLMYKIDERVN